MLIEIQNDVFNVVARIKNIDNCYKIYYNTKNKNFELYSMFKFKKNYELNLGSKLDCRAINKVLKSRISNINSILQDIENQNKLLEKEKNENLKNQSIYQMKIMFTEVM